MVRLNWKHTPNVTAAVNKVLAEKTGYLNYLSRDQLIEHIGKNEHLLRVWFGLCVIFLQELQGVTYEIVVVLQNSKNEVAHLGGEPAIWIGSASKEKTFDFVRYEETLVYPVLFDRVFDGDISTLKTLEFKPLIKVDASVNLSFEFERGGLEVMMKHALEAVQQFEEKGLTDVSLSFKSKK